MSPKILGMGNPLLDISAVVGQEMLDKYDVKLNNAILAEEKHLPLYEELVANFDVEYIAGGATQNSIRVAQWMIQQEGATAYIGCVGKDKFGSQLRQSAEADGVHVHYLEDENVATGTCACLIKDKERSLIANLGAANHYKPEHLDKDEIKSVWQAADIFYSAGFFLTVSPPAYMKVAEYANANKKTLAVNLSAPFICQFFSTPLLAAIEAADFVFGNSSEAEIFGQQQGLADTTPEAVALYISKLPKKDESRPRYAIITQGSECTLVAHDGKVTKYAVPAMKTEEIVDSNGAGDAFVGGFLAHLALGKSIEECVNAGHYAAQYILKTSGTKLVGKPDLQ